MNLDIDRIVHPGQPSAHSPNHHARLLVSPDDPEGTSPFLLMAEDWFSPPAGFPEHPHRGLQTVTIVLERGLEARHHTAGPGVHSLQLWLNLASDHEMEGAGYREQRAAQTPVHRGVGYEVRVHAGRFGEVGHGHASPWPLTLLDVTIKDGKRIEIEVAPGERAFIYVLKGGLRFEIDDTAAGPEDVVWFKVAPRADGEPVVAGVEAEVLARFLFFASPVIDEPVVTHGALLIEQPGVTVT
jgi:quercetin 2,3-dioxygenase